MSTPFIPQPHPPFQVVERLLPAFLPSAAMSGRAGRRLLREIVAVCVLRPALTALASSATLNLIIYNLLARYDSPPPKRRSNFGGCNV